MTIAQDQALIRHLNDTRRDKNPQLAHLRRVKRKAEGLHGRLALQLKWDHPETQAARIEMRAARTAYNQAVAQWYANAAEHFDGDGAA